MGPTPSWEATPANPELGYFHASLCLRRICGVCFPCVLSVWEMQGWEPRGQCRTKPVTLFPNKVWDTEPALSEGTDPAWGM